MSQAFARTALLLGPRGMGALARSRVAIFGLGGVGSWAAEALARSGVGAFTLVDDETVSESNINRQIHATIGTVGKAKVEAMRERILAINPEARVDARFEHYSPESAERLLEPRPDYVVDAIDTIARKVDLILRARAKGIPIISSMGAGDKLDPTMVEVTDVFGTDTCPLAREMRSRLRRAGVPSLKVAFSREPPARPFDDRLPGEEQYRPGKTSTPGSNAFVPPAFGLAIAAEIARDLAGAPRGGNRPDPRGGGPGGGDGPRGADARADRGEGERMIKGILFDMDGVLVDSESFIAEAAAAMLAERYGISATDEDFLPFVGTGENRFIAGAAARHGVAVDIEPDKARTYEIYFERIKGRLREIAGAAGFVRSCRGAGLRLAIATSADGHKVDANLAEIGLGRADFDAVVDGLQVERKKPFPDIYLEAARRLGLDPADCLVIEDALTGITAARAAGCACLGMTGSFGEEALRAAGAAAVVADLSGLDPGSLDGLVAGSR